MACLSCVVGFPGCGHTPVSRVSPASLEARVRSSSYLAGDTGGSPKPIPPALDPGPAAPSAADGKNPAEMLGFVEGEYITRGNLMRAIGPKVPTQDDREYEQSLHRELKKRVQMRVYVEAAHKDGLHVPPDLLDRFVAEREKEQVEEASKKAHRPVAIAEILLQLGKSKEEYRQEIHDAVLQYNYLKAVREGIPGKRPQVDVEPSPADMRRVYAAHREQFDVQQGAKIGWWKVQAVDYLDGGKRTYEQAVEEAKRRAEQIVAAARAGKTPDDIDAAQGFNVPGVKRENFVTTDVVSRDEFDRPIHLIENWEPDPAKLTAIEDWVFDRSRRAPDANTFEMPGGGLVAVAVFQVRASQAKTFEEVQEKVAALIRKVRGDRVEWQKFLELLQHATIWPASLAAELEGDARAILKRMDTNPYAKDIWLR